MKHRIGNVLRRTLIALSLVFAGCSGSGSSESPDVVLDDGTTTGTSGELQNNGVRRFIGTETAKLVWVCNRVSDADGSSATMLYDFGQNWMRLLVSWPRSPIVYEVVHHSENSFIYRLNTNGTGFPNTINNIAFSNAGKFSASIRWGEGSNFSPTFVRGSLDCEPITRTQATSSGLLDVQTDSDWYRDPSPLVVAGLKEQSTAEGILRDECYDQDTIDIVFYEVLDGEFTGHTLPKEVRDELQGERKATFNCTIGTQFCYSAHPSSNTDRYWGIDPNNPYQSSCSNYCYQCARGGVARVEYSRSFSCS